MVSRVQEYITCTLDGIDFRKCSHSFALPWLLVYSCHTTTKLLSPIAIVYLYWRSSAQLTGRRLGSRDRIIASDDEIQVYVKTNTYCGSLRIYSLVVIQDHDTQYRVHVQRVTIIVQKWCLMI